MGSRSKILLIGATGYIGRQVAKASLDLGHPTFLLVRESTISSNSEKAQLLESFKSSGANIIHGSVEDHASLVEAVKNVDVVISTVGSLQIESQVNIIKATKEVGTVKRFFPSEFGNDVDNVHAVEPAKSVFEVKAKVRRAIEAEGIPYTYVSSNCFAEYFLRSLAQADLTAPAPPRDKVVILGDGNAKETPFPDNIIIALSHSTFVKGDQTNFEIGPAGVEASQLYPDVKYTTVDEYLSNFV